MNQLAIVIFSLVMIPMIIATIGAANSVISDVLASVMRAFSLFTFTGILIFYNFTRKNNHSKDIRVTRATVSSTFLLAWLVVILLHSSMLFNLIELSDYIRVVLQSLFIFSLVNLFPYVIKNYEFSLRFINTLCNAYILLSLLIIIIALYSNNVDNNNNYYRFGYPLNPTVFAHYMLIAFILVSTVKSNWMLQLLFAVVIFASGSRLQIALAAISWMVFLIIFSVDSRRRTIRRKLVAVSVGIILLILVIAISNLSMETVSNILGTVYGYVFRTSSGIDELSSNRTVIWRLLFQELGEIKTFLFGIGHPPIVITALNKDAVAHNAFLNFAVGYGVPLAILVYTIWFIYFPPRNITGAFSRKGSLVIKNILLLKISLFVIITISSFFGNIFWTNMGDPATFFVSLILLIPMSSIVLNYKSYYNDGVFERVPNNKLSVTD